MHSFAIDGVDNLVRAVETDFVKRAGLQMDGHTVIGPAHDDVWMRYQRKLEAPPIGLRGHPGINVRRNGLFWCKTPQQHPRRFAAQWEVGNELFEDRRGAGVGDETAKENVWGGVCSA